MKDKEQKINELLKTAVEQNSPDVFNEILNNFKNQKEMQQNNDVIKINYKKKTNKKLIYIAASIFLVLFISSYALTNGMFLSRQSKSFGNAPKNDNKVYQSQSKDGNAVQESAEESKNGINFEDNAQSSSSSSGNNNLNADNSFIIDNLPTLKITSQNISIDAIRGGFQWNGICADSPGPAELVKNSTPLILLPNSTFKLIFSSVPSKTDVNIYNKTNLKQLEVINGTIKTPTQKGILICEVVAYWEQGRINYVFLINVK